MPATWNPDRRTLRSFTATCRVGDAACVSRPASPTSTESPPYDDSTDDKLIATVRTGVLAAYGVLYRRHVVAAHNLARQLARSSAEADDLVSETFLKVMNALRGGGGPASAFRAYLLAALRNTAKDKIHRDRKLALTDDVETARDVRKEAVSEPFHDTAVAGLERVLITRAFAQLPPRWQAVLWHTEIEGRPPADVAPLLDLNPNGVAALAYRARNGLCTAYLQAQLTESEMDEACSATAALLGAWAHDALTTTNQRKVDTHLDRCALCQKRVRELAETNPTLVRQLSLAGSSVHRNGTAC
jgi:RNA polymerase sigma factor (sigma-70 family)